MFLFLHLVAVASTFPEAGAPVQTNYGTFHADTVRLFCEADRVVLGTVTKVAKSRWRQYQTVYSGIQREIVTDVEVSAELDVHGSGPAKVVYTLPFGTVNGVTRVTTPPRRLVNPAPVLGRRYFLAFNVEPVGTESHDKGATIAFAAAAIPEGIDLPSSSEILAEASIMRTKYCDQ